MQRGGFHEPPGASRFFNDHPSTFDLTPYLKDDTRGEGVLNVTLGTHTFLKVKIEAATKAKGDTE
ncbi:MAG: hypothetical protein ACI4RA_04145 [Kiritimatiellia bacterium]